VPVNASRTFWFSGFRVVKKEGGGVCEQSVSGACGNVRCGECVCVCDGPVMCRRLRVRWLSEEFPSMDSHAASIHPTV
jgi:hypothetical protein